MESPKELPEWIQLQRHWGEMSNVHMRDLFAKDDQRFSRYSVNACGLLLDYSKNRINCETMGLLENLARARGLENLIEQMFQGDRINHTENRPAFHVALRNRADLPMFLNGDNVMPEVVRVLEQMRRFSESVRSGQWLGCSGKRITDIVNIGIGGSHLGPWMVTEALKPYQYAGLDFHFVSNIDGTHLTETLKSLNPETTLFIVASKSFTTQETISNAKAARHWLHARLASWNDQMGRHFVAVSANSKNATAFGIPPENVFPLWDWVGGRYSLWSAIGLPIVLSIGMEKFLELLDGAHRMDEHFRTADFGNNMPVIMALLGIWYNNFAGIHSHAVLPYDQYLRLLPDYLQQVDMESNGKGTTAWGSEVDISTGPIVWGSVGVDGQHAYFQLFHQGTQQSTCDFVVPVLSQNELDDHHPRLLANFIAQTEALMRGRTSVEARLEMQRAGLSTERIEQLLPHKTFPGNRPSNSILMEQLTPATLGSLLAMYEHKVFVQGVIWGINSFDQWGVELGKELASVILDQLIGEKQSGVHDCSTASLIGYCRSIRSVGVKE